MESNKSVLFCCTVLIMATGFSVYKQFETNQVRYENTTLRFENSMLTNEVRAMETAPSYDDGYRDAVIKLGGPQSSGSYQDGWNAAVKVLASNTYAEGYHTAIKQFGYTKDGNSKWIIEESIPKPSSDVNNNPKKER